MAAVRPRIDESAAVSADNISLGWPVMWPIPARFPVSAWLVAQVPVPAATPVTATRLLPLRRGPVPVLLLLLLLSQPVPAALLLSETVIIWPAAVSARKYVDRTVRRHQIRAVAAAAASAPC
jgi:hypothetical protein